MQNRQYNNKKNHNRHKEVRQRKADYKRNNIAPLKKSDIKPNRDFILVNQASSNKLSAEQQLFCLFIAINLIVFSATLTVKSINQKQIKHKSSENNKPASTNTTTQLSPFFLFGKSATVVSQKDLLDCQHDNIHSRKTCIINGESFKMYPIIHKEGRSYFGEPHFSGFGPMDIKAFELNRQILDQLEIAQPEREYFYEPNGELAEWYLATKNKQFFSYEELQNQLENEYRNYGIPDAWHEAREIYKTAMRDKIRNADIGKLAVASTVMPYLIYWDDQIGVGKNGITVEGADYIPFATNETMQSDGNIWPIFYDTAIATPSMFASRRELYFSLDILKDIKHNYQKLLAMPLPAGYPVSENFFHSFVSVLLAACEEAIASVPYEMTINSAETSETINELFKTMLVKHLQPLINPLQETLSLRLNKC